MIACSPFPNQDRLMLSTDESNRWIGTFRGLCGPLLGKGLFIAIAAGSVLAASACGFPGIGGRHHLP
jgi:hypothetical protein